MRTKPRGMFAAVPTMCVPLVVVTSRPPGRRAAGQLGGMNGTDTTETIRS
ncbi:hypothetical protein [Frankia canadensis]|nr:hypothetical protein [Frankia canadensis]